MVELNESLIINLLSIHEPIKAIRVCAIIKKENNNIEKKDINSLLYNMQSEGLIYKNDRYEWSVVKDSHAEKVQPKEDMEQSEKKTENVSVKRGESFSKKKLEKISHVIDYLVSLARINAKTVRTLDEYRKILWIHDIPHEPKYCFTPAWGDEDDHDGEVWIEIKKHPEPELPRTPSECSGWFRPESLRDFSEIPELFDSIVVEIIEEDPETGEEFKKPETIYLENYPAIQSSWDDYLENAWMPWMELYNRYASVQKVYADLFHIYQEQQKLGEQYELVFCKGLLNWKTPSGHNTKRHVIVAKASLDFEAHLGKFTVKQAVNGDLIDIELDMLGVDEQPQNARQLIENGIQTIGANLWDRSSINTVLNSIANSLADSGQGEYHSALSEPHLIATNKPIIDFSPALILRKRSMRGLEQILSSIKNQVEAGGYIPNEFLDLCECLSEKAQTLEKYDDSEKRTDLDGEIFFPLPANDEQRRIIKSLNRQKGVLVQGPPGTGKSHTIANLICHLLATGQRVLVTAKTPRALKVLHDKLPSAIKPLCINLLGQGTEERESLEKSVSGILNRLDRREELDGKRSIKALENKLEQNRKNKAETDNKILYVRESETFKHHLSDGQYSGTAATIARSLKKDADKYEWFTDSISPDQSLPLSDREISELCNYIVAIDFETEKNLSFNFPDIGKDLPGRELVRSLFQEEKKTQNKLKEGIERVNSQEGKVLARAGKEKVKSLFNSLLKFINNYKTINQRPMSWIETAVYDVLTDRDMPWKELLKISKQHTKDLNDLATKVDEFAIFVPEDMDRKKLLKDAKELKTHFASGGKTGRWVFKPKAIKEHGYLIGKVTVDGLDCDNEETLQKLIDFLVVEQQLDYTWSIWSGHVNRYNGPFPLQLAEIAELHEALESIIELYERREKLKGKLNQVNGLQFHSWENIKSLKSLLKNCQIVLAKFDYRLIRKKNTQIQNHLTNLSNRVNIHPIVPLISKSFTERDIEKYCRLIDEVVQLVKDSKDISRKRHLIKKLESGAPNLAQELTNCKEPNVAVNKLEQLVKSWGWAQGNAWLNDFLSADIDSLERHTKRLDREILLTLGELSAVKAWQFCFERMRVDHRKHLMAWQQSMKKLGKGTGKYAHTHRKNAQRHLNECRDAVPAWIMPLHRVYETVDAGAGIFDVVIVDEASQCGPEGLPLMYLGKKLLVVGDDKQISPEAVGVNRAQIQQLMRNFLYDFIHADSFDVESSLFDHGRIRFSNRISLREHFRCMPEIIGFSNDLCYRSDPLIPLRQYPPERLEPLKAIAIENGYREGSGNRVINKPEAEAIVSTIEECCKNERYQGMTMGVIVLQGEAQAYLIEEKLLQKLGAAEIERRRIVCGNPYSFQGDERNVIFLSLVAAPNERIGTLTKASDQRRFNVAASRAQDQMWLFYSATMNHLSNSCLRHNLLEYFLNPMSNVLKALGENAEELREKAYRSNRSIEKAPEPFDSWFEVDVALQIAGNGFRVIPQFEFANKRIDLVIQGQKAQLAVECDGDFWHGVDAYTADTERQQKLERCGWHFFRIRECRYYANPDTALEPLWIELNSMGIKPCTEETKEEFETDDHNDSIIDKKTSNEYKDSLFEIDSNNKGELNVAPQTKNSIDELNSLKLPENIYQAIESKSILINEAIIQVLEQRPNFSSVQEKIPTYILKLWKIRSRGNPRKIFTNRVNEQIKYMDERGYVIIYKSKNIRLKLGRVKYKMS